MFFLRVLLISLQLFFFAGCASKELPAVYIPVKCDIPAIKRPAKSGDPVQDLINVLQYTERLEHDLNFCRRGLNE